MLALEKSRLAVFLYVAITIVQRIQFQATISQPMDSWTTEVNATQHDAAPRRNAVWHFLVALKPWPRANMRKTSLSRAASFNALWNAIANKMHRIWEATVTA